MAEVTNDLVYETSKSMQARFANVENTLCETDNRLISLSNQTNAVHVDIYQSMGHMDGRLTRIEKRLDIIEEPAE